MAGWARARKGDGHGFWLFCAAAAAQGQAEAAEVTVMCTPGCRQNPTSDSSQGQLSRGTLVSWLSLHVGFLPWLGDTVPMSKLGIVLDA